MESEAIARRVVSLFQKPHPPDILELPDVCEELLSLYSNRNNIAIADRIKCEEAIYQVSTALKSSIPKLIHCDFEILTLEYLTISLKWLCYFFEKAVAVSKSKTTKKSKQVSKRPHLEMSLQLCSILLSHYFPKMKYSSLLCNLSEWKLKKAEFCSQVLSLSRSIAEIDFNLFWSNLSLFFSNSFKIDRLIDKVSDAIHSQSFLSSPSEKNKGSTSEASETPILELVSSLFLERQDCQSVVYYCLLQSEQESLQVEVIHWLEYLFTSDEKLLKRWLLPATNTTASFSTFGQRLEKIVLKLLQLVRILLYSHSNQSSLRSGRTNSNPPRTTTSSYSTLLQFLAALYPLLPITVEMNYVRPHAATISSQLSPIELQWSYLFEVLFLNCFSIEGYDEIDEIIDHPVKNKKKAMKPGMTRDANNNNTSDQLLDYVTTISGIGLETLKWLITWSKRYFNNRNIYHLPFLMTVLRRYWLLSALPVPLQEILSHPPPPSLSLIYQLPRTSSRANSSPAHSIPVLKLWNLLSSNIIHRKTSKILGLFLQLHGFLTYHYLPLWYENDSTIQTFLQALRQLSTSTNIEEKLLFLDYIQAILQHESSSRTLILSETAPASLSLFQVMQLILSHYLEADNHLLRIKGCETIGLLQSIHWKTLLLSTTSSTAPFLDVVIAKLLSLTTDLVGNVRTEAFRSLGEILDLLSVQISSTSQRKKLLVVCLTGGSDSKLSVRVQAAFALNKCLLSLIRTSTSTTNSGDSSELSQSVSRCYEVYEELLGDSEKVLTTAIIGLGLLIHLDYSLLSQQSSSSSHALLLKYHQIITSKLSESLDLSNPPPVDKFFPSSNSRKLFCALSQTLCYLTYHLFQFNQLGSTETAVAVVKGVEWFLLLVSCDYIQLQSITLKALTLLQTFLFDSPILLRQQRLLLIERMQSTCLNLLHQVLSFGNNKATTTKPVKSFSKSVSMDRIVENSEPVVIESELEASDLIVYRQDSLKKLLLLCLYRFSSRWGLLTTTESPSSLVLSPPLFSGHLEVLVTFCEDMLVTDPSFLLHSNHSREILPFLEPSTTTTSTVTVEAAISAIATRLLETLDSVMRDNNTLSVVQEAPSSILQFRLRNLQLRAPPNREGTVSTHSTPHKYQRFDGLPAGSISTEDIIGKEVAIIESNNREEEKEEF